MTIMYECNNLTIKYVVHYVMFSIIIIFLICLNLLRNTDILRKTDQNVNIMSVLKNNRLSY